MTLPIVADSFNAGIATSVRCMSTLCHKVPGFPEIRPPPQCGVPGRRHCRAETATPASLLRPAPCVTRMF
jgi:hypothetical protein